MVWSCRKVRPKKHYVYSVKEAERLYQVTANTVSNWVGAGLSPSDRKSPHLFRGAELDRFHDDRRKRSRKELRAGEAYCMRCKCAVLPTLETVSVTRAEGRSPFMRGQCSDCGAITFKFCSEAEATFFEGVANPNISNGLPDEEIAQATVDLGISATTESKSKGTLNDRIVFEWQSYAGKFDQKTVDQHIRAIRYMEDTLDRMSFRRLRKSDIARVRDDLKHRVSSSHDRALAKSTVKHHASHIKAFLRWLVQQDGYRRLPPDLAEYMELPKAFFEVAIQRDGKAYPTIDQAAQMVKAMTSSTTLERRDQAIVALAFLGALRADTLVSLLIKHIDVANCQVVQDASASRTKNGKSLTVSWFTVPNCFSETIKQWMVELNSLGFGPNDALFFPRRYGLTVSRNPAGRFALPCAQHTQSQLPSNGRANSRRKLTRRMLRNIRSPRFGTNCP